MPHRDFFYSSRDIKGWEPEDGKSTVDMDLAGKLAGVSGSIIIDGLQGEATARCGGLIKNAVTLGFIEDAVAGKTSATKKEYEKRIINNETPSWFGDQMGEG